MKGKQTKMKIKKQEVTNRIFISFKSKDSKKVFFTKDKMTRQTKKKEERQQASKAKRHKTMKKQKQYKLKLPTLG